MAMPGTMQDPLKPIKDKLDDIEKKVDGLSAKGNNSSELDTEIKSIKSDMSSISKSMKVMADAMRTETKEVREQKQKDMVKDITDGVNTHLSNVSESINTFNNGLGERLEGLHFSASLPREDAELLRQTNRILTTSNTNGLLAELKDELHRTAEAEKASIRREGSGTEEVVKKAKEEMDSTARQSIKNINNASYEGRERVRTAAKWVEDFFKRRWVWITFAVCISIYCVVGGLVMMHNAHARQTAAEQALKNANDVIERMPDYRYWIIYKARNPKTAAAFQKEMDAQYGKRLYKESINYDENNN